ncbi:MAG: hypothetical protein ABIW76_05050 [Fibrobacteria bacterium]
MKLASGFYAQLQSELRPIPALGVIAKLATLAILTALAGSGGLSGCKAVDLTNPTDTTKQVTGDSALISVTNDISIDADSLILLLYSENAVDVSNGALVKVLGGIGVGKTLDVKVPAGSWKLAYRDLAGNLTPMTDVNDGGAEWLKAIFVKNAKYALILVTDGNDNIWVPSFETKPAMK